MIHKIIDILAISIGLFILAVIAGYGILYIYDRPVIFGTAILIILAVASVLRAFVWLLGKYND
jgi:hypothetical protein